ncbi:hypothetical protein FB451DRAFT_1380562 [Mycena latifolia]|nr:hypothetical protein FB451DRAFT_1380562 [Mycena latifolia]
MPRWGWGWGADLHRREQTRWIHTGSRGIVMSRTRALLLPSDSDSDEAEADVWNFNWTRDEFKFGVCRTQKKTRHTSSKLDMRELLDLNKLNMPGRVSDVIERKEYSVASGTKVETPALTGVFQAVASGMAGPRYTDVETPNFEKDDGDTDIRSIWTRTWGCHFEDAGSNCRVEQNWSRENKRADSEAYSASGIPDLGEGSKIN